MKRTPGLVAPLVQTLIRRFLLFVAACLFSAAAFATDIMPLAQVQKGMRGYGLTVFDGKNIERFDVEILGVLNNIGPRQDLILAKIDSPEVRRSGVVAGMSGSPIYIDGKLIGALAYAWQFASAPIAGVTPIEEMLKIGSPSATGAAPAVAPRLNAASFISAIVGRQQAQALDAVLQNSPLTPAASGISPIAVPISFSRFSSQTLERFGGYFDSMNFIAVPSGSSAASAPASQKRTFQPGDAIGAVLVDGDFSVAATGTVTYVDGDRVYAFGHPFLDLGQISFPMATADVVTVLPNLSRSFKFANSGEVIGALTQDRFAGILGVVGQSADMIPIELTVDGTGEPQSYHARVVRNPLLSPLMIAMAADAIVSNSQRAAGERTIVLDSEIDVDGLEPITLHDGWAGADARQAIPAYLAIVSSYLMSNEFHAADIRSVKIHLHHDDQLRTAKIQEATVETPADGEIHPGDTVKVRTVLKPYRGEVFTETFDVHIPETMKPGAGAYLFVGSGSMLNQLDFGLVPPDPQTLEQVVGVIERLHSATDLMVGLYSPAQGAVAAGVYMPNLPPSVAAIVENDSSNSSRTPVRYHAEQRIGRPLNYIIDGATKIDLQIQPKL
jgi:SpoIVB peptidase S55.